MFIQKPHLQLKYFLSKGKDTSNKLYEQLLSLAEPINATEAKKLIEEYNDLNAKMSKPRSVEFYLNYYEVSQKLLSSISMIKSDVHGPFKWIYEDKDIILKTLEFDPAIALYNCAVCIQNEPGLYDIARARKMHYYMKKAEEVSGNQFEHIDFSSISSTLLIMAQECALLNYMCNPPSDTADAKKPIDISQEVDQLPSQIQIPQLPDLTFPDTLPTIPPIDLKAEESHATEVEPEISQGISDTVSAAALNLPDLPDFSAFMDFTVKTESSVNPKDSIKPEELNKTVESKLSDEMNVQKKQDIALPAIPMFEAETNEVQVLDMPLPVDPEPVVSLRPEVETIEEKEVVAEEQIVEQHDVVTTEPNDSVHDDNVLNIPTSPALEHEESVSEHENKEQPQQQNENNDEIFLTSNANVNKEEVETEHVEQIEEMQNGESISSENHEEIKVSNDPNQEENEEEKLENTANAFPASSDFILQDKIEIDLKSYTLEQQTDLTQNTHIISQAYKNNYKAISKSKGKSDYYIFVKAKYEVYKILSKYFFCNVLCGISRQYAKLVAEQAIKESNSKYTDKIIIDELTEFTKYEINDEIKLLMEQQNIDLNTVQEIQLQGDDTVFQPKKHARIIEKTFEHLQDSLVKRQEQLQTQKQAFLDKIKVVRQYLTSCKSIVPQVEKLQNFSQMIEMLMSTQQERVPKSSFQIQQETKQLQDMNAVAKQSYDYLAQLVSTDDANKRNYGEKRWNSHKYIQGIYRLMQDIVTVAERLQKQLLQIQSTESNKPGEFSAEVQAIQNILQNIDGLVASKALTISVHIEGLKNVESQILSILDQISAGLINLKTPEELRKYIRTKNLQLHFDDKVMSANVDYNKKIIQESMEPSGSYNAELEHLDAKLSEIYSEASKFNVQFVEQNFGQKVQTLEKIAERFMKSNPDMKKVQETSELLQESRNTINECNNSAKEAGKKYTDQVQQQWKQFASSQTYIMTITI